MRSNLYAAPVSVSALALTSLVAITAAISLSPAPAVAAPHGSSAAGGRAGGSVDLDLHQPPPGTSAPETPAPAPAGATLKTPRSMTPVQYRLIPAPDGGYLYQGPTFNAHILVDGTVEFSPRGLSVARDVESRTRVADERDPTTGTEDPVTAPDPVTVNGGPGVHFDAGREYRHRLGKDPAREAKAEFLTGTFDLRMKMAFESRSQLRRAALADLPARLDELWSDPRFTASERRHLLHAIRNELGEGPNNAGARAVVRDFARRHLPAKEAATFH